MGIWTAAILLTLALAGDVFAAAFAIGGGGVRVPKTSALVINAVCTGALLTSAALGAAAAGFAPEGALRWLGFVILLTLGLLKLAGGFTKSLIRKYAGVNKEVRFQLLNIRFALNLYADPVMADADQSKTLSPVEAAALAAPLSMDGLCAGFGVAAGGGMIPALAVCSVVTTGAALALGTRLGRKIAGKLPFDAEWLGGAILIVLAATRITP